MIFRLNRTNWSNYKFTRNRKRRIFWIDCLWPINIWLLEIVWFLNFLRALPSGKINDFIKFKIAPILTSSRPAVSELCGLASIFIIWSKKCGKIWVILRHSKNLRYRQYSFMAGETSRIFFDVKACHFLSSKEFKDYRLWLKL